MKVDRYEKKYARERNRKKRRETECREVSSSFVLYNGVCIRKSTALYILQENLPVSSDRLLRFRFEHPPHIFTGLLDESEKTWDVCQTVAPQQIFFRYMVGSIFDGWKYL